MNADSKKLIEGSYHAVSLSGGKDSMTGALTGAGYIGYTTVAPAGAAPSNE